MERTQTTEAPLGDERLIRLLLVEDDPGFQLLIQRILERMQPRARVETVEDAATALSRIGSESFDLVLLDYSLPGRNGLDVLRDLKASGSTVPVVMVTGMGSEKVAVEALKLGAYDYLVKSGDLKAALPLVVRRVFEKVRLEDGLKRFTEENERLKELDRLKSQFIANVSHELRTPLVSVTGYLDMLVSGHLGSLSADQRRALQVCSRNTERLKILIDNILNLSSLEAHKVKPVPRPFDVAELISERVLAIRPVCEDKKIELEVSAPELPVWVSADPELMEQVLWNLLGNAHKFTPEGGRIEVRLRPDSSGTQAIVEVEDTGCGIQPDKLPRIFERFWQADSSPTRKHSGLGLGLAIVQEILDAHETTIHVTSEPDRGTTFTFSLPLAGSVELEPQPEQPRPTVPPTPNQTNGGARILVVDDEADTREFVKTALEMAGHRVLLAEGGRTALRTLKETPVDIVLLDVAMSGLSGVDVLRHIRSAPETVDLPVVLMTAIADPQIREQGIREGADGILEKPLRTSALLNSIEVHLRPNEATS